MTAITNGTFDRICSQLRTCLNQGKYIEANYLLDTTTGSACIPIFKKMGTLNVMLEQILETPNDSSRAIQAELLATIMSEHELESMFSKVCYLGSLILQGRDSEASQNIDTELTSMAETFLSVYQSTGNKIMQSLMKDIIDFNPASLERISSEQNDEFKSIEDPIHVLSSTTATTTPINWDEQD
ncbi:MAG: hypothetical protein V4487_02380 [Chlamydiota bacterium]